jgi:hypothetical protein
MAVQVRSGKAWSGLLSSGWARRGGRGPVGYGTVWFGAAGSGKAVKAVMVWYSKTRSGNGLAGRFRYVGFW